MRTATKLTAFLLGLVAVFGAAYGVGQVTGPVTPAVETHHDDPERSNPEHDNPGAGSNLPGHGPDRQGAR
ncbi:hypothetical protein [Salinispora tropica]|uniref:Secreted protein n=1 Tax=Salinispora tropica (strain ATCC BAA-916 / DSM 44818 / JCM 13857 / NBRC 105044 / CNB-440) TaxID=369723 RepID=A4X232_SALTO|nr:hypothetical protein [Salinispora tropica]ABP52932.1 hypothetical protein Strop_0447 [Salinispora tropica CNB-440]